MLSLGIGLWNNVAVSGGGAPWTPNSISGILFYGDTPSADLYKDNVGTTLVSADGDAVGYISDLSSQHTVINDVGAGSTVWPIYHVAGSVKSLQFDGINDGLMSNSGTLPLTDASGQWSAWAKVTTAADVSAAQSIIDTDAQGTLRIAQCIRINSGHFEVVAFTSGGSPTTVTGSTTITGATDYSVVVICSTTTVSLYVNGTLDGSAAVSGMATNTGGTSMHLTLGAGNQSTSQFYKGKAKAWGYAHAALSSGDRANVFTYLGTIA